MTRRSAGLASPETRADLDVAGWDVADRDRLALERRLTDQALRRSRTGSAARCGSACSRTRRRAPSSAFRLGRRLGEEERPVLGVHHRRDLAHDQLGHRGEVALALEHPGDARQVGLQPVLLGVALGGLAQVGDHLVDVVLELGHLALSLDRDRPGQVALGHRGRHLGDRAELGGQGDRQLVDVLGQPPPRAGHALDLGLAAQLALGADLAGDAGHLGREARQLRDHPVQRLLELEDLAAGVDGDRLGHVAVGHRGRDLGDVADLVGQVAGHEVDVVGQVLPGAGDAGDLRPGRRGCPRFRPRARRG